ncbi:DUF805 domain-containing protein [Chachezhania antarctica]|uniref:DUF805 domain-containing protein n=1 Tax=Chachezhania antarctica TaxID=2340860 RepID=UPI001F095E15|nr:DUF805 domain-containing protein [Chachezhania antarctica]|tara:strand:- start:460 stop:837 length:378 start_codon:yes stop_codon:yes gene_type:complete
MMSFPDAVKETFSRYFDFQGRSRRSAFWWTILFVMIVSGILTTIDTAVLGYSMDAGFLPLSNLFGLVMLIPMLALYIRRLHDIDRTGWWLLIGLIPLIGFIVLIVFWAKPGTAGENRFGRDPSER